MPTLNTSSHHPYARTSLPPTYLHTHALTRPHICTCSHKHTFTCAPALTLDTGTHLHIPVPLLFYLRSGAAALSSPFLFSLDWSRLPLRTGSHVSTLPPGTWGARDGFPAGPPPEILSSDYTAISPISGLPSATPWAPPNSQKTGAHVGRLGCPREWPPQTPSITPSRLPSLPLPLSRLTPPHSRDPVVLGHGGHAVLLWFSRFSVQF